MSILTLKPLRDILSAIQNQPSSSDTVKVRQEEKIITDIVSESLDIQDAPKGLTAVMLEDKTKAVITVSEAPIRFRIDGELPTADVGHFADVGSTIEIQSEVAMFNFKAIRATETTANIFCTYLKEE